jgi:hypothetical protein
MRKKSLLSQTFLVLLFSPALVFAQAPDLGTAATFTLFTAKGAFTNTGATRATGDIGTDAGDLTGFPAGIVTGAMQVENAASAQAATDVRAAYGDLSAVACGVTTGVSLGGQTLTPNTYCTGAAATLNGVLTLDGNGDTNALFIINIAGALATGKEASVVLINGATVANVYWRIGGRFDLGENAVFRGTILADGAINLLDGATLVGRALSQAGAITLARNTVSIQAATPLPVELTAFSAEQQGQSALLRWATASERNSAYFEVQSSTDGRQFTRLTRVAGQGNSTQAHAYSWADLGWARYAAAVVYYRLKQVDTDGTSTYSPVRSLASKELDTSQFQVFPNPSQTALGVQIAATQQGPATLRLTNALGQLLLEKQIVLLLGRNLLDLPEAQRLQPGYYHLQLQQGATRQVLALVRQ